MLERYGIEGALDRPRERVLGWVARVHEHLMSSSRAHEGALAEALLERNARLDLFYLEGILKLYKKRYEELARHYDVTKRLEDRLGHASAARGFAREAEERRLPAAALAWFADEQERASAALTATLVDDGWLPEGERVPALSALVDEVRALDWDGYDDDRAFLAKRVAKELKDIAKADLDLDELQGDVGIHELRRQLRWVAIYLTATSGLFTLVDDDPVPEYRALLALPIAKSRYAQLPVSERERAPLAVSRSLYVALTKHIEELGAIKDRGERVEAFAQGLMGGGLAQDLEDAERRAIGLLDEDADAMARVREDAKRIWAEIQERDLIQALRKDVKDG